MTISIGQPSEAVARELARLIRETVASDCGYARLFHNHPASKDEQKIRYLQISRLEVELQAQNLAMLGELPVDLYCSQHDWVMPWFKGANGEPLSSIRKLRSLYIDLDCYHVANPLEPGEAAARAIERTERLGLPRPAHIDFSGHGAAGGLYLRWLIEPELPADGPNRGAYAAEWKLTERSLVAAFQDLGADPKSTDIPRVLRLPMTFNTKYLSGGLVEPTRRRVLSTELVPLRAFDPIVKPLLIAKRHIQVPAEPENRPRRVIGASDGIRATIGRRHPHAHVLAILERLAAYRGGIAAGRRNSALYLYTIAANGPGFDRQSVISRAERFARDFNPPLSRPELTKTINGALHATRMRISNRLLIEQLDISPTEAKALNIKPAPIYRNADGTPVPRTAAHRKFERERQAAFRKSRGVKTRLEANREKGVRRAHETQMRVDALLKAGSHPSISELCRRLKLSRPTVRNALKSLDKRRRQTNGGGKAV